MTLFVVELRFLESMLYIIALWCTDACTRYNANLARVGKKMKVSCKSTQQRVVLLTVSRIKERPAPDPIISANKCEGRDSLIKCRKVCHKKDRRGKINIFCDTVKKSN